LGSIRLGQLGKAEKVLVTSEDTTIIGGAGSSDAIQGRISSISARIAETAIDYDKEKLQERLAMLAGSVAMLKAGGISEDELLQEVYRLESAMHSARSAIEHGAVVGGGIALLRAGAALKPEGADGDLESQALQSIASVLEEPTRQLVANAKKSPTEVLE
jgi:chaperonin GroEL